MYPQSYPTLSLIPALYAAGNKRDPLLAPFAYPVRDYVEGLPEPEGPNLIGLDTTVPESISTRFTDSQLMIHYSISFTEPRLSPAYRLPLVGVVRELAVFEKDHSAVFGCYFLHAAEFAHGPTRLCVVVLVGYSADWGDGVDDDEARLLFSCYFSHIAETVRALACEAEVFDVEALFYHGWFRLAESTPDVAEVLLEVRLAVFLVPVEDFSVYRREAQEGYMSSYAESEGILEKRLPDTRLSSYDYDLPLIEQAVYDVARSGVVCGKDLCEFDVHPATIPLDFRGVKV